MGRQVRKVPANWQHPKKECGNYKPLLEYDFDEHYNEWVEEYKKWGGDYDKFLKTREVEEGFLDDWGSIPESEDYMPKWKQEEETHFMMYEDTSEGTPISPAFETPEELAQWLFNNKASAFGNMKASYDDWLSMIKQGSSIGAVCHNGKIESGVTAMNREE